MIQHKDLGETDFGRLKNLAIKIREQEISLGGNRNLRIYGTLDCKAGKRMKVKNRVFFKDKAEAIALGYRPCFVCRREEYKEWRFLQ